MKPVFVLSAGLLIAAIGCKGGDSSSNTPVASYAIAQGVLTTRCMSCHGGAQPAGRVDLTNYEGVSRAVKPGDIAGSELIQVMRGTPGFKKMPPTGPPATEQEIQSVEAWIEAGAKQA